MGNSVIVHNGETIMNLEQQTCEQDKVLKGTTFFGQDGELQTGTIPLVEGGLKIPSEQQTTVIPAKSYVTSDVVLPEAPDPMALSIGQICYDVQGMNDNGMGAFFPNIDVYTPTSTPLIFDSANFCEGPIDSQSRAGIVRIVNDYLFYNNSYLAGLFPTKSQMYMSVGNYSFYGCSNLQRVPTSWFPDFIGNYAFYGCTLINFSFQSALFIGKWAFRSCSNFNNNNNDIVVIPYKWNNLIPSSVICGTIGDYAFYGTKISSNVKIGDPDMVSSTVENINDAIIGNYAFYNCQVGSVKCYSSKNVSIGSNAFQGDSKLKNIELGSGKNYTVNIGNSAFKNAGTDLQLYTGLTEANNTTNIGTSAFENSDITRMAISANSVSVDEKGFYTSENKNTLTGYVVGYRTMTIGKNAFYGRQFGLINNGSAFEIVQQWNTDGSIFPGAATTSSCVIKDGAFSYASGDIRFYGPPPELQGNPFANFSGTVYYDKNYTGYSNMSNPNYSIWESLYNQGRLIAL